MSTALGFQVIYRNSKLLKLLREIPCQSCGASDGTVVAAHRNEGKGMGLKNSDALTCSLCYHCHYELDAGNKLTKDQKRDMWNRAYVNTMQYLWEHDMIGIK